MHLKHGALMSYDCARGAALLGSIKNLIRNRLIREQVGKDLLMNDLAERCLIEA